MLICCHVKGFLLYPYLIKLNLVDKEKKKHEFGFNPELISYIGTT